MTSKTAIQKRVVGGIVRIDLGDGFHAYARVLDDASYAIYDCRVNGELPIDRIISSPILFQVAVMDHAVKRGRWVVVGSVPLDDSLMNPQPKFIQDALQKDVFRIYHEGKIRPARKEECVGLECAAVWEPNHVEDRLRDHYAGSRNIWLESLRIKE